MLIDLQDMLLIQSSVGEFGVRVQMCITKMRQKQMHKYKRDFKYVHPPPKKNTYTLLLRDETYTETRRGRFRFTANQTVCHFLIIPEPDRAGPLGRGETDVLN